MRFNDHIGRTIELSNFPPKRIVCLVPSLTETLFHLGLDSEVVGITRFCVHPREWFLSKKRIGGTKDFRIEDIRSLRPDLIIANKEENTLEGIEELEKEFPIWVSDIQSIDDAIKALEELGNLTGKTKRGLELSERVGEKWQNIPPMTNKALDCLYFIWKKPWMTAGNDTFIHSVLEFLGLNNLIQNGRYPTISINSELPRDPEIILFSSEPFPFKEEHFEEWQSKYPNAKCLLVDGEAFSWYGSRMLHSANYLKELVNKLESKHD